MKAEEIVTILVKSEGFGNVTVDINKLAEGMKEIELESKGAKAGIKGLKEENKQLEELLKRENEQLKALNKEMAQLKKAGLGDSKQMKALASDYELVTKKISGYEAQMRKNEGTIKQLGYAEEYSIRNMKISDMTMTQLSRRAEYLTGKLNNTSKSLNPEEWNKYNNQLIEVKKRQEEVSAGGEKVKGRFDSIGNTIKKVIPLMVAYSALRIFQNLISGAVDWLKKAPEVAAKAEGITRAFTKLNNTSLLTSLRKETKGLISDMVLMQSTVKADRFGIPINNLGKYLKFAQQRAQETGQSVDYLTESIINGLGRKSPLILDNLGISAARLKAEMKKGLDFTQATTKIVEEELKKQGDLSLTSADKATQASVKWENAQLKIGNRLKWLSDKWNEFSGNVADAVGGMAGDSRTASQVFDDQNKRVADLNVNILPLIDKYDKLKDKVKLTYGQSKELDDEHKEMLDLVGQITAAMPHLRTEFDQYGRAIGFSSEEARKFIETQKAILPYLYAKQLAEAKSDVDKYKEAVKKLNEELNNGGLLTSSTSTMGTFSGQSKFVPWTEEELVNKNTQLAEFTAKLGAAERAVAYFTGNTVDIEISRQQQIETKRNEFNAMTDLQLKSWINMHKNATSEVDKTNADFIRKVSDKGIIVKTYLDNIRDQFGKSNAKQKTTVELTLQKQLELAQQIYSQRVGFETPPKEEKESKILARQKEELKARLENQETAHKYELMEIKANAEKKGLAEDEYQKLVLDSDAKYYSARIGIYDQFVKDYNITNEKFKEDIKGGRADTKDKLVDISPQVDKNRIDTAKRTRDESLRNLEEWINKEKLALEQRNLSVEQTEHGLELIEIAASETRLTINKEYAKDVQNLEIQNGRTKTEAVREAGDAVVTAETEVIAKRKALAQSMKESNYNVRSQFGLTTREEDFAHDQKMFQDLLAKNVIDYETYQKLLSELNLQYEDKTLQIKQQYNIAGTRELYDAEMAELKNKHEQGYLSEEEYEKAKWQMKLKYATDFGQKITQLTANASAAVSALMAAETAKLDAEYDVRIAAAEGNKEETERLENEKAQKKLDIEKKYADVQFAIKASDIIANTAVAIMTGYAQLGPIAGSIAAAFLGITGAAQLIAANAEREKVKNMTLAGASSSSGSRGVIVAGKEEGGYINVTRSQDGKKFNAVYDPERRGFVDRPTVIVGESGREWVLSNGGIKNPTIAPVIGLIDEAQRNGTVESLDLNRALRSQRLAGYASGGSLSNRPVSTPPSASPAAGAYRNTDLDIELLLLLRSLNENGVIANIGITELEAEKKRKQDIDNKFTLKD
nr:MAG TPA_asm: tail tape measure protein [Caudoviricetes sp.]